MRLSQQGYAALVAAEGLRLKAYPDPATGGEPWTIGIGCTTYRNGSKVKRGDVLTHAEAHSLATWHIEQIEEQIAPAITVPVDPWQWDALVSLCFNIGIGAFKGSTLLKKLNSGDYAGAAAEFDRWNIAAGKVMQGLVSRRKHERAMFEGSLPAAAPEQPAAPIRDSVPPIYPPEKRMPLPAILAAVIPSLLSAAPDLIKLLGDRSKESSEQYTKLATKAAEIAVKATDAINVQEAVEKLESDPEARSRYQMALKDEWFTLSEAGGGGITGAREFAETMTSEGPQWRQIAFSAMLGILALGIVIGGGAVMAYILIRSGTSEATASTILDYFKALGYIVAGYVFGSSAGSRRKDELLK